MLTAPGDHLAATNALRAMFTRDFVYLGVSVLQVVLVALVTPILTRRVGVGQYGQLALAIVVAQLLGVTLNLGLPFAAQKVFAGEDGDRRSRGVLAISAVLRSPLRLSSSSPHRRGVPRWAWTGLWTRAWPHCGPAASR